MNAKLFELQLGVEEELEVHLGTSHPKSYKYLELRVLKDQRGRSTAQQNWRVAEAKTHHLQEALRALVEVCQANCDLVLMLLILVLAPIDLVFLRLEPKLTIELLH